MWRRFNKRDREDGFTLLELITACAILGILAAIAIPTFNGHHRTAIEATVVSDVRQAAMEMEKEAIFSATGYAPVLPETFFNSNGNTVLIDKTISSEHSYCIVGMHPAYEDMFIYYSSEHRRVTHEMNTCGYLPPESFGDLPLTPEEVNPDYVDNLTGGIVNPPEGYDDPDRKKFEICHNGNKTMMNINGIINGHAGRHGDIIPPIGNIFVGENWTGRGAAVWYNDCVGQSELF